MSVNIENTNLTKWELNDTEVAYYVRSPYGSSSGSLPLYIPKLMPNISMGKARSTRVNLNKSCYCNDSGCKPAVSSQLSSQNYLTISPQQNRSFREPHFRYGAKIQIEVHNQNDYEMYITTKIDNSTTIKKKG